MRWFWKWLVPLAVVGAIGYVFLSPVIERTQVSGYAVDAARAAAAVGSQGATQARAAADKVISSHQHLAITDFTLQTGPRVELTVEDTRHPRLSTWPGMSHWFRIRVRGSSLAGQ